MNSPISKTLTISSTASQVVEIGSTYSGFIVANTSDNKVCFKIGDDETTLDTVNSYKRVEPSVDTIQLTGEAVGQKIVIFKY